MNKNNFTISHTRWLLVIYDLIIWVVISGLLFYFHPSGSEDLTPGLTAFWMTLGAVDILLFRILFSVYKQVWRYGGIGAYFRLISADIVSGIIFIFIGKFLSLVFENICFIRMLLAACMIGMNLLLAVIMRMCYYLVYRRSGNSGTFGNIMRGTLRIFGHLSVQADTLEAQERERNKKRLAIVGAGRVGTALAEELISNSMSGYNPICFIENDYSKIGRRLLGIPIIYEKTLTKEDFANMQVEEIILAVPDASFEAKQALYGYYKDFGVPVKIYDYPFGEGDGSGNRAIRDFTIEELLARKPVKLEDERLINYYKDKVVLVTGGGGSIGSELSRQIASMGVKKLIILDIAENTTYELQQDLRMEYGDSLDLSVEIVSVCDKEQLEVVFRKYRPQIILHAAAHKHVPLMEHNCVECVKNNVFGTLNVIRLAMEYKCEHFILVSTDKAVNPTNIMGATKRICELMLHVAAKSEGNETVFSATRFGNVLGSAGSVVPLFKKQIAKGGPVTITDKNITRYFMTIPEASQLVLTSGAMAKNGELFVLDMGKPVRIYDLAENMIKLSGLKPGVDIEIVETGLRPGEKLYEELLITGVKQGKTENELIFVEEDDPLPEDELNRRLTLLEETVDALDDEGIKNIMPKIVPTYSRRQA